MFNLIKIKGDASFREFFRKKKNYNSSILVVAKKENIYSDIDEMLGGTLKDKES